MSDRVLEMRPTVKQVRFLQATQRHVCYGGARGGGKSWIVRGGAMEKALKYPGIKQLIVRKTYQELLNNHITPLRDLLHGIAKYNDSKKMFYFYNGSTLALGYCSADKDLDHFQGAEYDIIYLEESTNLREEWIERINACVRGTNPDYPKQTYYTCNPGGVSHAWHRRIFVDRRFKATENPDDYIFIQAKVTDNLALMAAQPEYVKGLEALPPKLRKAWLEGSWDIYEGQFFEDFLDSEDGYETRRWTHVIKPFMPRQGWEIYRSFDWGYHRPFSCGWWAVDYDGVLYRIAELYGVQHDRDGTVLPNEGVKWTPERVFSEIQRMEHEHPYLAGREIHGVADPAIWDAETGISFAETASKYGVFFQKGDNRRIPGWMQCHYRLAFDDNGYPMMYVFDTCKDFIRTVPMMQYDEHKAEDLDTSLEDHICDEWRYMCMARPIKPMVPEEEYTPAFGIDPLNQFGKT